MIDFGKNRRKISIVESLHAVDSLCCRKIWIRVLKECLTVMRRVREKKAASRGIREAEVIEDKLYEGWLI